ncbi:MAG: hypothetical protein DIKNOCCD_01224 [bacterium]|nr:hypothetical protein [bacterium]MBV6481501.1 hypothetical protein [bacterium]
MRISALTRGIAEAPQILGRARKAGATQSASIRTEDLIEFSAFSKVASGLGKKGLEAVQQLIQDKGISESRLTRFLKYLNPESNGKDWAAGILGRIASTSQPLDTNSTHDLLNGIEGRKGGNLGYLDALDQVFNLGYRDVPSLFRENQNLSDEDFSTYLKSVAKLLKAGVIGTETVELRGQPVHVFIENEIGSDYSRLPLWRKRFPV